MRNLWLALLAAVGLLGGCAPVVLGENPARPYSLEDFPTFTSPVGQNLFGKREYSRQRWEAVSRPRSGLTVEFSLSILIGAMPQQAFDIAGVFGNPIDACAARSSTRRDALGRFSVALGEAPAGWGVGIERAEYVLDCGERVQQADGTVVQRFTTALELLYRFTVPPSLGPGTYPVRWQVLEGSRAIVTEDRRFVLVAR
ncbi:MAG: hypothetical protein SFU83_16530 [Meiothermus sp.]|nr:hypothetical protein [Meiothermus sp.]